MNRAALALTLLATAMLVMAMLVMATAAHAARGDDGNASYLTRLWKLDGADEAEGLLNGLSPHRQNYVVMRKTSHLNRQPVSPAAGRSVTAPYDLDALEAKFQLSMKADIASHAGPDWLGVTMVRYWLAYTQQSNWQIANTRNSEPFRETNYEPEFITTFVRGDAARLRLVNLGFLHQSNGRALPESRKWNRLYVQGGWESGRTSALLRRWWRLADEPQLDDNPDITRYAGLGDLMLHWEPEDRSQSLAVLLRSNLQLDGNRSFAQLDWATPKTMGHAGRLHVQLTTGYGESLIDYNHRQTTLGLGLSFREW
ncbi:MAG TPA: phospholipase A [Gallionella sp.]